MITVQIVHNNVFEMVWAEVVQLYSQALLYKELVLLEFNDSCEQVYRARNILTHHLR